MITVVARFDNGPNGHFDNGRGAPKNVTILITHETARGHVSGVISRGTSPTLSAGALLLPLLLLLLVLLVLLSLYVFHHHHHLLFLLCVQGSYFFFFFITVKGSY